MKRISRLTLAVALVTAVLLAVPATANHGSAVGEVAGNVSLTNAGGIPLLPVGACANTTYTFSGVILRGSLTSHEGQRFAGSVGTGNTVTGGSTVCESAGAGEGIVNTALSPAAFSSVPGAGTIGSASGTFCGRYIRRETIVNVALTVNFSVNGGPTNPTIVYVTAQFTPTQFFTSPAGIKAASFEGEWGTTQVPTPGVPMPAATCQAE